MIFVGSKVFTHARYWQIKKVYMHDLFVCVCVGGGGGTEHLWGGPPRAPPGSP